MLRTKAVFGLACLAYLLQVHPSLAHEQGTTYVDLIVAEPRLEAVFSLHTSDLIQHFSLDRNTDQKVESRELEAGSGTVRDYILSHVSVVADGETLRLAPSPRFIERHGDDPLVKLHFFSELDRPPAELEAYADFADRFGEDHVILVKVSVGRRVQQAVLVHEDPRYSFQLGDAPLRVAAGSFLWLGIEHIFLGYDHILFLVALLVATNKFKQLLKIVTAFSIAHSLTLTLAALELVMLPTRLIEAAIAASIVYVAAENFWMPEGRNRWPLAFGFGLIHGFGFANVLRDLGLPTRGLALSLLSFNVGVEFGQIMILALLFPFTLWLARGRYEHLVMQVVSALVLLFGLGWLVERAFGLEFMPI